MGEEKILQIYESMLGLLEEPVQGVEDAFAPGSECDMLYEQMREAYEAVCARLGKQDDPQLDAMVDALLRIQKLLCKEMYRYGWQAACKSRVP